MKRLILTAPILLLIFVVYFAKLDPAYAVPAKTIAIAVFAAIIITMIIRDNPMNRKK